VVLLARWWRRGSFSSCCYLFALPNPSCTLHTHPSPTPPTHPTPIPPDSLAELKGFEIKRRGELKLIKVFQAEVFEQFLAGVSLAECYGAVGAVANRWLDMLDTQGVDLSDSELLDYISEATTMSKAMDEYEGR